MSLPFRSERQARAWLRAGRPVPVPHAVKARNILTVADIFGLDVLVETGTYKGAMIAATLDRFQRIFSIEILAPLAAAAMEKFASNAKVTILQGDSQVLLPPLLTSIEAPILFWLDGHFSGKGTGRGEQDTPVMAEIEAILKLRTGRRDAIIIDDARLFTGSDGYPVLSEYLSWLKKRFGNEPRHADDAIFILPR